MSIEGLDALLAPRSVAVIGASSTRGKNGNTVVRNLLRGFRGRIVPVNASGAEVEGLASVTDIRELADPVDCAMLMIPAAHIVSAARHCAEAGLRSVVVGAAGFAESGTEEGARWQAELSTIAAKSGMRILGPNTNGFYNASAGLSLGYNGTHAEDIPHAPISILSHSGALFGSITRCLVRSGSGLEKFVSVGNEADIGLLDLFELLVEDPATEVIGLVLESLAEGPRFRRLAARAKAAGKSVVGLKVGRSRVGSEASLAHSSRLAGSARAYAALFEVTGIGTVSSPEALAGACASLAGQPPRSDAGGLLCVTTSGAGGALLADYAEDRHLPMAGDAAGAWTGELARSMAALPSGGAPRNPIDVGALRDWSRIGPIFDALTEGGVDGPTAAFAHIAPRPGQDETLAKTLADRRHATRAPVVVAAPGGLRLETEALYASHRIPVFHNLATAMDSLAPWLRMSVASVDEIPAGNSGPTPRLPQGREILDEKESSDLLLAAGVPMVPSHTVGDPAEAAAAGETLGYPVVLKALVPDVVHKMKEGHLVLDLGNAEEVCVAMAELQSRLSEQGHDPAGVPYILQPMRKGQFELIVGMTREDPLGQFLVVGLGGSVAEALDRTLLLPIPLTRLALDRMLTESWLAPLLETVGGSAISQLADLLHALQSFALAHGPSIRSIDINPVLVGPDVCIAVDAAMILDPDFTGKE